MHREQTSHRVSRRTCLALAGLGVSRAVTWPTSVLASGSHGPTTELSPAQALDALKDGNARYRSAPQQCAHDLARRRMDIATHQAPWATILGCADSRVPPELLFGGLGLGELFVARNAGNLADIATLGTLEYGAAILGTPIIVVLGHARCGAVGAACEVVIKNATFPGSIGPMIEPILPAAIAVREADGDFIDNAVRENARRTAARLTQRSQLLAGLVAEGKLKIVAARYDLDGGTVEFLE